MTFAEDTSDFINSDTPGYALASLGGVDIEGLFNNGSANAMSGMVLGTNPTFTCAESAAQAPRGKTLIVNSVSYTVRATHPDGTGFTLLELEKV